MKKLILFIILILLASTNACARTSVLDVTSLIPLGCEQETSLSSSTLLSGGSIPTGATIVLLQAQDQNVRWRDDGTEPTITEGIRLLSDESIMYNGKLNAIRLIEETASATVNVCYYKK